MNPQRLSRLRQVLDKRQPDLTVLMDGVHKPHNFAAVLRSCDAAGVFEAHGVWTGSTLEPGQHISAGTGKWMRIYTHPEMAAACGKLRQRGFALLAANLSPVAVDFREVDYTRPTALILGAELHGFNSGTLALADRQVCIPMLGMAQSLNVSVAAAVILFEAQRQRRAAGLYDHSRLAPDVYQRTLFEWAHPRIAAWCRRHDRDYPALAADGEPTTEFRR